MGLVYPLGSSVIVLSSDSSRRRIQTHANTMLAFPLKSAILTILILTASLASGLCRYGKATTGFVLHLYNKQHCDTRAKDIHHETFSGARLNMWKNIVKSPCLCLHLPPPLAGNVQSFVFTSGSVLSTSVMFFEGKYCNGNEVGEFNLAFSSSVPRCVGIRWAGLGRIFLSVFVFVGFAAEKWIDPEVTKTNIHSAYVCAIDVAEWLKALAQDGEEGLELGAEAAVLELL
ncbi:hypothetical protein BJ138DRAFT_457425 [Hygrophoropsis aurantiaca]|uniref:Uncharacterized protein n=1 Tax=Hygrophoropsis aurantiaca TaxID=72124 RepID=A0ACB8A2U6_9AGAM|nr:hypothetical protein BJ138DRAFT_457425 [Hygrophoropsis aurantiaca]